MRFSPILLVVVSACWGSSSPTTTTTTPSTQTTPTPTTEVTPPPVTENDSSICASRGDQFGPIELDATQAARRRGRDVTKFSAAKTTKEKPLEVCGVTQQQQWLMTATCDDGSRPYQNRMEIAKSRRGSIGPGGTCGTIIDLYVATCPEAAYELHMDMYHCGPGESFM